MGSWFHAPESFAGSEHTSIANAMEQSVYGVTGPEVAAAKADLQTRVERVSTAAERGSAEAAE